MSPQIVLDTSAVAAYSRGSVAVGELIMIAADEGETIGVPVTCVAEAHALAKGVEAAMLHHLASAAPGVTVLPLLLSDAANVGLLSRRSSLGVGHAIATAKAAGCYLATADGATIRRLVDDDRFVIDL
ncbi:MAG TPA: hypothetical protein VJX66_28080 [Amycolatopsis sp.]|nr:hypothetical protein [Amycolatopsis sp.]